MERVLIVGQDAALRAALRAVLEDVGYGVVVCGDARLAQIVLRLSQRPFVVLLVDATADADQPAHDGAAPQPWTQVFAAVRWLPPHAYIVLSRQPPQTLAQWNVHTQRFVPVVPLPFDLKLLLSRVAEAVRRLRFVAMAAQLPPHYGLYHVPTPGGRHYYDTTVVEYDATSGTSERTPPRTRHDVTRERARTMSGLLTARAVVVQAHEVEERAWQALVQARTALEVARAGWGDLRLTRDQHVLAQRTALVAIVHHAPV